MQYQKYNTAPATNEYDMERPKLKDSKHVGNMSLAGANIDYLMHLKKMNEYIDWLEQSRSDQLREGMEKIIKETSDEHPYSVTGRPETYDQYNQGWEDACDILGNKIIELYEKHNHTR